MPLSRNGVRVSRYHYCKLPQTVAQNNAGVFSYGSVGQKSPMGLTELKAGVGQGQFLLQVLGENSFPCLLQPLEATHIPRLLAPCSIFKTSRVASL